MLFRQLFDHDSSTYTYLLADAQTREAVIIDPVFEQFDRDRGVIEELELELRYSLETHVHADHVTATTLLRKRFGAQSVISERAGVVCADLQVKHGDLIRFGAHALEVRETPGHTDGCLTYVSTEPPLAFTGDALLIRGCGRTDFQSGDSARLFESVHAQILSLPDDTLLYPAHDYKGRTVTSVREEKRHNPRLGGGRSSGEFVKIMAELSLPYPRKIDAAVPANVRCGGADASQPLAATQIDPSWAPIGLSLAGVPELDPEWLRDHAPSVQVIDVREPDEYRGELGHLTGAELVPLAALTATSHSLSRDRPIVLVCRSGGRSGRAAVDLAKMGFPRVASLRGGMVEWRKRNLPVQYGAADGSSRQG
ncbi:MAG TPA: rhodanese-like domain-containing protein [Polyangiales bacterium]|nr:rhodanese-like domain-containing protein [Polyangiales bacterium]